MDEKRVMDVLQRVAEQNGVPLVSVIEEIERVIDSGVNSSNPQIRVEWKQIPRRGAKPSVTELMTYLVEKTMEMGI